MMNLTDLKYFKEMAKHESMRKTSEALHVSQPALTHALRRLEEYFSLSLFERHKKGIKLTKDGIGLLKRVDPLLVELDMLKTGVQQKELTGQIKLGCHPSVAIYTLSKFLDKFLSTYKHVEIKLDHELSRKITQSIIDSDLDVGIVVNPIRHPDLILHTLCEDIVTVWVHPECVNKDVLIYDPSLAQAQWIIRELEKKKISFTRKIESSNLEVIANLVDSKVGAAILPFRVVKNSKVQKFEKAPEFKDEVCLAYKPSFRNTVLGKKLVDAIKSTKF